MECAYSTPVNARHNADSKSITAHLTRVPGRRLSKCFKTIEQSVFLRPDIKQKAVYNNRRIEENVK